MKKNVVIILLLIVSISFGTYIIYDEFLKEEKMELKDCNKEELCDEYKNKNESVNTDANNYFTNLKKNRTYKENNLGNYVNLLLDQNGNIYYKSKTGEYPSSILSKVKNYEFKDYVTNFGDNHIYEGIKLDISNVLTMYYGEEGQSGNDCFVFIKENGNVSYAEIDYDLNVMMLKDNISGLKNIVSVIQSDGYDWYSMALIDADGKIYELNKYIEQ